MALRMQPIKGLDSSSEAIFGAPACWLARLVDVGGRVPAAFVLEASGEALPEEERSRFRAILQEVCGGRPVHVRCGSISPLSDEAGIQDPDQVIEAVERCIREHGPVAVRVQVLPIAATRGRCLTQDPDGSDVGMVFHTRPGPAQPRGEPEVWRVYRSGQKAWIPRRLTPEEGTPLVSGRLFEDMAESAAYFADHLRLPLDLEWMVDPGGWVFWLSVKPLEIRGAPPTMQVERATERADDGPVILWSDMGLKETVPFPLAPLTWSIWRNVIAPEILAPLVHVPRGSRHVVPLNFLDRVEGRVYWNINGLLMMPWGARLVGSVLRRHSPDAADAVERLVSEGVIRPRRFPGRDITVLAAATWASCLNGIRLLAALSADGLRRRMDRFAQDLVVREKRSLSFLSGEELLREIRETADAEHASLTGLAHVIYLGMVMYRAARRAFRSHPEVVRLLAAGVAGTPATAMAVDLEDLARAGRPLAPLFLEALDRGRIDAAALLARIEKEPDGPAWISAYKGFLARHGHRRPGEMDLERPRWSEDPAPLLALLAAVIQRPPPQKLSLRLKQLAQARREALDVAIQAAPAWRRPWLRFLEAGAARYLPMGDRSLHCLMLAFQRVRLAALELGRRLVDQRIVDQPDDILFLEYPELDALVKGAADGMDYRGLVKLRRQSLQDFRTHRPPEMVRSDGVPVLPRIEKAPSGTGVLSGQGVSDGLASGPVRHLHGLDLSPVEPGDVLVMDLADAAWAPLFPWASAIVVERGSLLNPAAVVAREMGLPAVFGVHDAMRLLVDGEVVTVDGTRGTVSPGGPAT